MSRRTCRALAGLAGSLLLLGGLASAPAQAGWGASQLVSVDNARLEQADGATNTIDMSGDGRWVVFQTRAGNFFADDDFDAPGTTRQGGVFRFDRQTGAIQLVADGDLLDEESGTLLRRGAVRPSVSDDGRTVVFATGQQLVPQDTNDNVDVYVRDMDVPVGADRAASGAYTLVSARDGGDTPAQYAPLDTPLVGGSPGSDVFAGQAISGDGRYVAFRTADLASDLPSRDAVDTPPFNVFVRDLAQKRTVLVSPASDGSGGAGGAQSPVVLSRDGSTVSWVGQHAADQTRFLPGENSDSSLMYYLWRRWDDPDATTRRVTGQVDPDDPACDSGRVDPSPVAIGPCYGPLADFDAGFNDIGSRAPALSADGWTVAFLSGAAPRPAQDPDSYLDAYVTSMRPGVSRKAGTRAITRGTTAPNPAVNGEILSVAMPADGSRLLLVTGRRQFLPPAPPLVGEPRSEAGGAELYMVGLGSGGDTRRVLQPGGAELAGAVDPNPVLSADGHTIAFISAAPNLTAGDANEQADAFAVTETPDAVNGPPPAGLGRDAIDDEIVAESDDFDVRAITRPDGRLLLRVTVPRPGALRAVARTKPVRKASRRTGRDAAATRRGAKRRVVKVRVARPRQVATARATARRSGTVQLTLKLGARDRAAVRRGTPLAVRVTVTLTPQPRARTRTTTTDGRFRIVVKHRRAVRRAAARRSAR